MKFLVFLFVLYPLVSFAEAENDYFLESYKNSDLEIFMVFSKHTTKSQDNDLKRLFRILNNDITERQKSRLAKQIKAKLDKNSAFLAQEKFLISKIKQKHELNPFDAVLAEFSEEKRDRYLLRIEIANFVKKRLHQLLKVPPTQIDDFLLLLTGEDVYPLLEGNFLEDIPLVATEDQELLNESRRKIGVCKGVMGILSLGQTKESQYASKLFKPYLIPNPKEYPNYLKARAEFKEMLLDNGLLRLRIGADSLEDVEAILTSCDALFSPKRDNYAVSIIKQLPQGNYLLTRGIAHRWLFEM